MAGACAHRSAHRHSRSVVVGMDDVMAKWNSEMGMAEQWGTVAMFVVTCIGFLVILLHMTRTGCHLPPKPHAWTWTHYNLVFSHSCHLFTK